MRTEELIEAVAATSEDAVVLATVVSLAVRIEPFLLRKARLTLTPGRPASAESELWFSPLVSSSSPRALILRPEVAAVLRERLATHSDPTLPDSAPTLFVRAHRLVEAAHAGSAPTLQLEEAVIWAALTEGREAANNVLASAVRAMREQPSRARGVARWALRALPNLPPAVRATEAARVLRAGAELRMTQSSLGTLALPTELASLVVPEDGPRIAVGVRLLAGGIEFSEPPISGAHEIELPDTVPLVARIGTAGAPTADVEISRGKVTAFALEMPGDAALREVAVTVADGERYRLRETARRMARMTIAGSQQNVDPTHDRIGDVPADELTVVQVYLRARRALDWVDDEAARDPRARRPMSRAEFAGTYGAAEDDVAAVRDFMARYGIDVIEIDRGRRCISVRGSVAALASAFGAEVSVFAQPDAGTYRARRGSLTVPVDVAEIITGVFGIDNRALMLPAISRARVSSRRSRSYTPDEVAAVYSFPRALTGAGETIGIIACGGTYDDKEVEAYFAGRGERRPRVLVRELAGQAEPPSDRPRARDGVVEASIEIAGSLAPEASFVVYLTDSSEGGILNALSTAVHDLDNAPSVILIGYAAQEVSWTGPALTQMHQVLMEATALGVTVVAAAGNRGTDGAADSINPLYFPASDPHALACGGTSLWVTSGGEGADWVEAVWGDGRTGTSGGVSPFFTLPPHQRTAGIPLRSGANSPGRGVPDVAAVADPETGYQVLLDGAQETVGGTAAAAALWASLVAVLNQAIGRPVGFLSPLLYGPPARATLRDITQGASGANKAAIGWDPCTGLGTPDGTALLQALREAAGSEAPAPASAYPPSASDTGISLFDAAREMFALMMRNVASAERVFTNPTGGQSSLPGCIIAAPYALADSARGTHDYIFHWVRDAAIAAMEIAAAATNESQALIDYVNFAALCQDNAGLAIDHACFTIDGFPRPWSQESDGPALQTLAILEAFPFLDAATKKTARTVIEANLRYLQNGYLEPTINASEEHRGLSFFARAAQRRCFQAVASNPYGIAVPEWLNGAWAFLERTLESHWDASDTQFVALLPAIPGYDPNMEVVMACVYGAMAATDPKLLASAAKLRRVWADPSSAHFFPINAADQERGIGPLIGRYPDDSYASDEPTPSSGSLPWTQCTCNFAELYYRLAREASAGGELPLDPLSQEFFWQVGVDETSPQTAVTQLVRAGDSMLEAVVFHSDQLRVSQQFDAATGYARGARDLTLGYASFLSALRARTGVGRAE